MIAWKLRGLCSQETSVQGPALLLSICKNLNELINLSFNFKNEDTCTYLIGLLCGDILYTNYLAWRISCYKVLGGVGEAEGN